MSTTRFPPQSTGRRGRALHVLKTVPILPSLVTLGNVFFGFLAMAKAGDAMMLLVKAGYAGSEAMTPAVTQQFFHKLEVGALLIFVAMLFDAFDGAVARMTRQTSAFGAQLDSMADMVTFGVAPAFLAKVLIDFHTLGPDPVMQLSLRIIYVSAVVYVLCATMRLARFNVEIPGDTAEDHQEFAGLPSPAAAATIAALLYFFCALEAEASDQSFLIRWLDGHGVEIWIVKSLPVCLVMAGLLMISRFPYSHVMVHLLRRGHSFPFLASLVVIVLGIALEHEVSLVVGIFIYMLLGIVHGFYRLITTGRMERMVDVVEIDDDRLDPPTGPTLN